MLEKIIQNQINYQRKLSKYIKLQEWKFKIRKQLAFFYRILLLIFRDTIYIIGGAYGYQWCRIGQSIQVDLIQKYELNTIKIWLWDQDNRVYRVKVFIKFQNIETKIYESNLAQSVVTIRFPDQLVEQFRIYNTYGNTYNIGLHVIKVEAYYQFIE
ncbi:unnamed protein product [Paramecium pentaurelia]|uniref:Transmembrane protein n=1 Tax=Paramecium pentaurelia TaxID=43138 RepID=A0A8S1YJA7_9CILI|nr:unnamed protein product [Paramecium pentaurelia]